MTTLGTTAESGEAAGTVEAVLADQLMRGEDIDALLNNATTQTGSRLPTGVASIDSALGGGIPGGSVLLVSADRETGSQLPLALLTSSLLTHPCATAAVIDATGRFDVLGLYARLLAGLRDPGCLGAVRAALGRADVTPEEGAKAMLEHVRIMRVFDFVGVEEAVAEVREGLEGGGGTKGDLGGGGEEGKEKEEEKMTRSVIADSEDEDEEMLFDAELRTQSQSRQPGVADEGAPDEKSKDGEHIGSTRFILIDNLAHVLAPLLKQNAIQANAHASAFLSSLADLTRTHTLHTVLLNSTTTPRVPTQAQNQQQQPAASPPSIFSSNATVPSAMGLLGRSADVHMLVSRVPRGIADARVHYGHGHRGKIANMVDVVEVIGDRWAGGVGAWGVIGVGDGIV